MEEADIKLVLNQVKSNLRYPELFPLVKCITLKCILNNLTPEYVLNDILEGSQNMSLNYYPSFLSCCKSRFLGELAKDEDISCEELESYQKIIDSLISVGLYFGRPDEPVLMLSGLIESFEQVYCLYVEHLMDDFESFKSSQPEPLPTRFLEFDRSVIRVARLCFWLGLEDEQINLFHQWMSLGKQSGITLLQGMLPKIRVIEREVMLNLYISDYN
ncbi:hypothetical protein M5252_004720 [Vibrio parahaemolyticus]|nr:hypothetical protein [Vibrio parahaemolyticus]EJE8775161.1 hypothetical protein [Vibrio parahaemolyticus]